MTAKHELEDWKFCTRQLGGKFGPSYAVDLPNGARIFSSSNDDNREAHMRQVSAVPQLVRACRLLVKAYHEAEAGEGYGIVDWDDVDIAYDAAELALGIAGVEP
jgi:hypothetical protein